MIFNLIKKKIFFIRLFFLVLLIIVLHDYFDKNKIFEILKDINYFFYSFLIVPLSLIIILMSVKWYLIIKDNDKNQPTLFHNCFETIVLGLNASFFTSSSIAMDITKAYNEKKRSGIEKSIYFVLYDKIVTIFFKIFFIILIFNIINILILKININIVMIISLSLLLLLRLFFSKFFLKKINHLFKIKILKNISSLFIEKENLFNKLFMYYLVNQFLIIFIYLFSFLLFEEKIDIIKTSLAVPIIEIMSQIQVIMPGIKEAITVYVFSFLNLNLDKILVIAILLKFIEATTSLLLLLINFMLKKLKYLRI